MALIYYFTVSISQKSSMIRLCSCPEYHKAKIKVVLVGLLSGGPEKNLPPGSSGSWQNCFFCLQERSPCFCFMSVRSRPQLLRGYSHSLSQGPSIFKASSTCQILLLLLISLASFSAANQKTLCFSKAHKIGSGPHG